VIRTSRVSLKYLTASKARRLSEVRKAYVKAVNQYLAVMWACPQGPSSKQAGDACKVLPVARLTSKYRAVAYRQAHGIATTAKAVNSPQVPVFNGGLVLPDQCSCIKKGAKSFDFFLAINSFKSRRRIHIPVKKTRHFNDLLALPGARIKRSVVITPKWLIFNIEIPEPPKRETGLELGLDQGANRLISSSAGVHYCPDFKAMRDKICRRKPGSKGKRRSLIERDNLINRTVNQLPWANIKFLAIEDLTGMKVGKRKNRSREFRRQTAPWSYRQVITRIEQHAQLNGVELVSVNPAYTSQKCPNCGTVSRVNRVSSEEFKCVACGHAGDADHIGALNILAKARLGHIRELEVP
jgi:IS605 OrfB family transposase